MATGAEDGAMGLELAVVIIGNSGYGGVTNIFFGASDQGRGLGVTLQALSCSK